MDVLAETAIARLTFDEGIKAVAGEARQREQKARY